MGKKLRGDVPPKKCEWRVADAGCDDLEIGGFVISQPKRTS